MKKFIVLSSIILALSFPTATSADYYTDNAVEVVINGEVKAFSPNAVIVNGNTMVPFRQIFETYGATVIWDSETRTITATKDEIKIVITIDRFQAYVNEQEFTLTQTPFVADDHTFVNLRFISEALGANVAFQNSPKPSVIIDY